MLNHDLLAHGMEFARAIDNHQYEVGPSGLHFPKQKVLVAGQFDTWINGADHQVDPNILPTESLNYLLKTGLTNVGGLSGWYVAPFVNNVTPLATLTAATATATLGEFQDYNEANRVAYTVPVDPAAGSYSNSAAPAQFTIAGSVPGGGVDIYGAMIISAAAKAATTGKILCASKFTAARKVFATDVLTVLYTINATST